jgi:hypothetical protein
MGNGMNNFLDGKYCNGAVAVVVVVLVVVAIVAVLV